MLSSSDFQIVLIRHQTSEPETNVTNGSSTILGHWTSDVKDANNITISTIDYSFANQYRYHLIIHSGSFVLGLEATMAEA
jgi:hypothetical protein